MIQGGTDNPRKNHGELFRAILIFAEHLRGNHGESVWVITPLLYFKSTFFFFCYPFVITTIISSLSPTHTHPNRQKKKQAGSAWCGHDATTQIHTPLFPPFPLTFFFFWVGSKTYPKKKKRSYPTLPTLYIFFVVSLFSVFFRSLFYYIQPLSSHIIINVIFFIFLFLFFLSNKLLQKRRGIFKPFLLFLFLSLSFSPLI